MSSRPAHQTTFALVSLGKIDLQILQLFKVKSGLHFSHSNHLMQTVNRAGLSASYLIC